MINAALEIQSYEQEKPVSILQLLLLLLIGTASAYIPFMATLTWLAAIVLSVRGILKKQSEDVWYVIAATPMLEVWGRMSKAMFLPFEMGKYYLLIAIVLLLFQHVRTESSKPVYRIGLFVLLLLVPSLIVGLASFNREEWVFNILSIIELAFLLMFAARERWTIERFCKTIRFALLPSLFILTYLTQTASFSNTHFSLSTNFESTNGFGTNQVSTVLGNGIVLIVILLILDYPIFKFRWMSVLLLVWLLSRGLVTMARGGMIAAIICTVIAILPSIFISYRSFFKYIVLFATVAIIGFVIFNAVNNITGNKLLERFMGETQGTLSGSREKSLTTITTGRSDLAYADMEIFKRHSWFGVGPGNAKELRVRYGAVENTAAHTELTRLMSENGIGGLLAFAVLMIFPLYWLGKQRLNKWKGISAALFTLALFTSFHSAMRTNTTVVFYVLAAMPVVFNNYWLRKLRS